MILTRNGGADLRWKLLKITEIVSCSGPKQMLQGSKYRHAPSV